MSMADFEWNPADVTRLLKLADAGLTGSEISAELGRSRSAVFRKLQRVRNPGLPKREHFNWDDVALARLRDLYGEGYSFQAIAVELGCSRNAAIGKAHRIGLSGKEAYVRPPKPKARDTGGGQQQKILASISRKEWNGLGNDLGGGVMSGIRSKLFAVPSKPVVRKPDVKAPEPLNLSLLELTSTTCKWATTENLPHAFCGHETFGLSYCPHHCRLAYTSPGRGYTEAQREAKRRLAQRDRRANFGFVPMAGRAG